MGVRDLHCDTVNVSSNFWQAACGPRAGAMGRRGVPSGHAGLVAPLRLGLVQRLVGARQHGVERVARVLPGGDANAELAVERMAGSQCRMNALCHGQRCVDGSVGQQLTTM